MKTYKSFEEYMYDNYYDEIHGKVRNFLFQKKGSSFLSSKTVPDVKYFEMEDFHIEGASFSSNGNNILDFRLTLTVEVSISGKSRYDYESESKSVWVSVYFTSLLENGLHNVRITKVDEYSQERFKKEDKLNHFFVPYLYSEDADVVAEKILKGWCPAAVETPMPLPIVEIVHNLGLKMYYAPLDSTTFGRTYFDTAVVTVYEDFWSRTTVEITITAGTLLINPDIYFMRNVGSVNNTIIHECVHWQRHRMFFELKKLLNQDFSYITCKVVESYGKEKSNSTPLDWIEWQANTLAPKILMPATATRKFIQDRLYNLRQSMSASARDDSYYRACFLCREITADSLIEAEYNPDDGKNQLTEEEAAAIEQIMKLSQQYEIDFDELPGSFHKTVDHHITRKGLTAEELSYRSKISTQTISELRNKTDKPVKIETLLKLFIGLNLNKEYCYDLMKKAGIEFPKTVTGRFYRWLVDEHTDESIERWQLYLNQAHINCTLCKLDSYKVSQS